MDALFIKTLFQNAIECLKSAERVYFCCYSIPEADMDFKYIIKQVESDRKEFREVYLCNSKIGDEELNRITNLFKNKDHIHNTDLAFEQFVEMPHSEFLKKFKT